MSARNYQLTLRKIPKQCGSHLHRIRSITFWGCLWWKFTVNNRRLNIECMLSEHSDSAEEDHAVCKFLSNSLLCMLWRYNGKDSINWFWFGSFWNVTLAYKIHYSWWTTHTTSDQWKFTIIQKVNKTQLKLCLSVIQTLTAFKTCSKYTKSSEVNPQKTKQMKMMQTFSLLWDTIPRSRKRERLWLL